jgi:hypothetical protein
VPIPEPETPPESLATAANQEVLAEWAESYADQTERDHSLLVKAVRKGEIKAEAQPEEGG